VPAAGTSASGVITGWVTPGTGTTAVSGAITGPETVTTPPPTRRGTGTPCAEDYHRTSEPPVFEVVSTQRADTPPPQPKPTRSESAWRLLADGKARAALREFAVLALRSSGDAEARAGYGLAAALLGKHDTAVWAFRRAVITDADVLDDLAGDERLTEPLKRILDEYARALRGDDVEPAERTVDLAANK
jgi:hypothetical protein